MNSNKKLFSVLLTAVLLVACTVGVLIFGANAAATTWTVGEGGDYTTIENALSEAAKIDWEEGQTLTLSLTSGTHVSSTPSPLLFDQHTIWIDQQKGVKLPIRIEGVSNADTSVAFNMSGSRIACANDYTFANLTMSCENKTSLTFFPGSGRVAFENSAIFGTLNTVNFSADNFTYAAFQGWKTDIVDENGDRDWDVYTASLSLGTGVKEYTILVARIHWNAFTADATTEYPADAQDKSINPKDMNAKLIVPAGKTYSKLRYLPTASSGTWKDKSVSYFNDIILEVDGGTLADTRISDVSSGNPCVQVRNLSLIAKNGATTGSTVWLLDYAVEVLGNLTVDYSGAGTSACVFIDRARQNSASKAVIHGDLIWKLHDGFKLQKVGYYPAICHASVVEGNLVLDVDNADFTYFSTIDLVNKREARNGCSGTGRAYGSVGGIDVKIRNCKTQFDLTVSDHESNTIGQNGVSIEIENCTKVGKLDLTPGTSPLNNNISLSYKDSKFVSNPTFVKAGETVNGNFSLYVENYNEPTRDIIVAVNGAAINGAVDIDLNSVNLKRFVVIDRSSGEAAPKFGVAGKENTVDVYGTSTLAWLTLARDNTSGQQAPEIYGSKTVVTVGSYEEGKTGLVTFTGGGQDFINGATMKGSSLEITLQGNVACTGTTTFSTVELADGSKPALLNNIKTYKYTNADGENVEVYAGERASSAPYLAGWRYLAGDMPSYSFKASGNIDLGISNLYASGRLHKTSSTLTEINIEIEGNVTVGGDVYLGGPGSSAATYTVKNMIKADEDGNAPVFNGAVFGIGANSGLYGTGAATIENTIEAGTFHGRHAEIIRYLALKTQDKGGNVTYVPICDENGELIPIQRAYNSSDSFNGGTNSITYGSIVSIKNTIKGGQYAQAVGLSGYGAVGSVINILGVEGAKDNSEPAFGRGIYAAGYKNVSSVDNTIYSGSYGERLGITLAIETEFNKTPLFDHKFDKDNPNGKYVESDPLSLGAGVFMGGGRQGHVETICNKVYGGHYNGFVGGGFGRKTNGSTEGTVESFIYGGEFEILTVAMNDTDASFTGNYSLTVQPKYAPVRMIGAVRDDNSNTIVTAATCTLTFVADKYAIEINRNTAVGLIDNVDAVVGEVKFLQTEDWVDGKQYIKLPAGSEYVIENAEGVNNMYLVNESADDIKITGHKVANVFYGLQPDPSDNRMKIAAFLDKAAVEKLVAGLGDAFEFTYEFIGEEKVAKFSDLTLSADGKYYTIDLGYIKASQFYLPYSFEAFGANSVNGDFLALLAKNAADEAALDAEVKAILKALYAYGYQAGAAYDADFSYEDVAGLGTVADKEALIEKYQWTTMEEFYKAESKDEAVYDIYGMGTKLGNQISISIYAIAPELAAGDTLTVKFNEDTLVEVTLKATTVKINGVDTEVVYFTLNPSLNTMGDIYRMTILDGEVELGKATVSIAGYAVGVIEEEDLPEEELYYAILAYVDAASALTNAQ